MKLYWLKRLALKWLVNDQSFYFIMAALRGPDICSDYSSDGLKSVDVTIKEQSTARIRGKVGLSNESNAIVSSGEPLYVRDMTNVTINSEDETKWSHFNGHIASAIRSLQTVGYK